MKNPTLVALASAALVMVSVWSAGPAAADGKHVFRGPSHQHHHNQLHSVPPKHFPPPRFHHKHHGHSGHHGFKQHGQFGHHGFKNHGHFGWGGGAFITSPGIVYSAPAYVPPPPVYVPTPVYVPSPPAYAPPVSSAPLPSETVIEFPDGRYELRGDGISVPYRWVWVPKPPMTPPSDVTPSSAPKATADPPRPLEVFRWTDEAGVVHLTDRLEKVPEAYRAKVTKSQS